MVKLLLWLVVLEIVTRIPCLNPSAIQSARAPDVAVPGVAAPKVTSVSLEFGALAAAVELVYSPVAVMSERP